MVKAKILLQNAMTYILENGNQSSIKIYTESYDDSDYDDISTFALSGAATWVSGIILPVLSKQGSSDALMLEQGKLLLSDKKLYVEGSVDISGAGIVIGIGSPTSVNYNIIPNGVQTYSVENTDIYKKIFLRQLTSGSLS